VLALNSQMVRFRFRTILIRGRAAQSFEEHLAIVEAVAAGDAEKAEPAMHTHLNNVARVLERSGRHATRELRASWTGRGYAGAKQ
jgi:DNA-binding FadR family transcriptional regulator